MSLDKTAERLKKIREQNRLLRKLGVVPLTEPGPWFSIPAAFQFDPSFFPGLTSAQTAIDKDPIR